MWTETSKMVYGSLSGENGNFKFGTSKRRTSEGADR
jgi:hypothetical protein